MKEYIKKLLCELCQISCISGRERAGMNEYAAILERELGKCDKTALGNLIFYRNCEKESAKTVLIDAHADEIGMIVTGVHDGGFLSFASLGGIDTRILSGADVTVYGKNKVRGVIAARAPHLMSREESERNPDIEKLYIDTGLDKEWLEENAGVGCAVGFEYEPTELLGDRICAHGLDNKASIAAAIAALKMLKDEDINANVALMLSVREELAGAGALTGAYDLKPSKALVLDVNFAFLPENPGADVESYRRTVELGEGVAVSLSASTNKYLTRELIGIAKDEDIAYQTIVEATSTGTNADRLALKCGGISVAVMGTAVHNMHTYSEIVSINDVYSLAKLIYAYLKRGDFDE